MKSRPLRFLLLLSLTFTVAACQMQGAELPFDTLAKSDPHDLGSAYKGQNPDILVFAQMKDTLDPNQAHQIQTREIATELSTLDYEHYLAILVFYGYVGSSGFVVTVHKVIHQGDKITVWAEFTRTSDQFRLDAFTSPYHLVAIPREGLGGKQIRFILQDDNQIVAETSPFIP